MCACSFSHQEWVSIHHLNLGCLCLWFICSKQCGRCDIMLVNPGGLAIFCLLSFVSHCATRTSSGLEFPEGKRVCQSPVSTFRWECSANIKKVSGRCPDNLSVCLSEHHLETHRVKLHKSSVKHLFRKRKKKCYGTISWNIGPRSVQVAINQNGVTSGNARGTQ